MAKQKTLTREERIEGEIAWLKDKFREAIAEIEERAEFKGKIAGSLHPDSASRSALMAEGAAVAYGAAAKEAEERAARLTVALQPCKYWLMSHVRWCQTEARIQWKRAGKPVPQELGEGVAVESDGA